MTDVPPRQPGRPFPFVEPIPPKERPEAPAPPIPVVFEPAAPDDAARSLADRRIVFVSGRIDDVAANNIVAQLVAFDGRRDDPVTLLVNSTGGPLYAAVAVLDTMAGCTTPVAATVVGQAYGTAALLVALASGERLIAPNASVSLRLERAPGGPGTADDIIALAEQRKETEARLSREVARRTNLSEADALAAFDRGQPMPASEAIEQRIADRLR